MGRKTRKTRWRTLAIADESDSEESNTLSASQITKGYNHRQFYSKFTYSSQSTPTRRFPYEPKSTRSSSTASENKITFNEDEYTKITTPRQDVLFKKGYLSKPKNYQTQTSTGNSTASTGNSTGNGTPDHQSADGTEGTDLEYESQFVFPNAFVDQNGIYYINSYEHYPLVMYNPPICYPEYPSSRTKRHSTGSLAESTSPNTEETSQDLSQSGGENAGNPPEFNHVYNVVYPGYYFNGVSNPNATTNGQASTEPRKIKKKRRRKISKTFNQDETTSSEDGYSSDEAITQVENRVEDTTAKKDDHPESKEEETEEKLEKESDKDVDEDSGTIDPVDDPLNETAEVELNKENLNKESKFNLDAEEFVPRAYRPIAVDPNLQFVNIHPNFVPLPLINHPLNELNQAQFNPPFLPPGIPLNFVTADPKLLPNFVNFVPNHFAQPAAKAYEQPRPPQNKIEEKPKDTEEKETVNEELGEIKDETPKQEEVERLDVLVYKNDVDIAKIVSKLEEAAKEQNFYENRRQIYRSPSKFNKTPRQRFNSPYQSDYKPAYDKRKPRRFESKSSDKSEEIETDLCKTEPKPDEDVQKYSPRHHNSPRKYINYNNRSAKAKTPEQISQSAPNTEYSDTLKKPTCPRFEKYSSSNKSKINPSKKAEESAKDVPKISTPIRTSQWIPVSSKKKRKNRSTNEEDDEPEIIEPEQGNIQIEVPVKLDDIIEMITNTEPTPIRICSDTDVAEIHLLDVKEIEKELLKNTAKVDEIEDIPLPKPEDSLQSQTKEAKETKEAQKKKTKRTGGKTTTKRIIILDPDISKEEIEKNNNSKTKAKIIEIPKEKTPELIEKNEVEEKEPEIVTTPDKKKSKKKKKQVKSNLSTSIPSLSGSSTTLNQIDDSYDFLLHPTALVDDKTNIEVSEELDKMIQKGLFGNLEEKFRSLNVSVDDDFFKSLSLKPKSQSTPEKGFIKATNFTTILNNTNQSLPKMKTDVKLAEYEPQPSTSKTGDFLEKSIEGENEPVVETIPQITNTKGNGKLKNKSKKNLKNEDDEIVRGNLEIQKIEEPIEELFEIPKPAEIDVKIELNPVKEDEILTTENISIITANPEESQENSSRYSMELKPLYPITQAVKEWMTKTRETTPEIEILKSPDTIYKEFVEDSDDSDSETKQKNALRNPSPVNYFDRGYSRTGERVANATCHDDEAIEEGEDVLELIENKNGTDEDLLRLKEDEKKRNGTFPKHGNLPYRAICCSLM